MQLSEILLDIYDRGIRGQSLAFFVIVFGSQGLLLDSDEESYSCVQSDFDKVLPLMVRQPAFPLWVLQSPESQEQSRDSSFLGN